MLFTIFISIEAPGTSAVKFNIPKRPYQVQCSLVPNQTFPPGEQPSGLNPTPSSPATANAAPGGAQTRWELYCPQWCFSCSFFVSDELSFDPLCAVLRTGPRPWRSMCSAVSQPVKQKKTKIAQRRCWRKFCRTDWRMALPTPLTGHESHCQSK